MSANGYTRQSASQIASGQGVASIPVNNEFNQLVSAFAGTGGHDHSGGSGLGPQLGTSALGPLTTTSSGLIIGSGSNTFTTATITGTSNQITVVNGTGVSGNPTLSIATGYVGQTSLTTLGTITTGVWNGTVITGTYGGTGVNNGANTITIAGNIVAAGAVTLAGNLITSGANSLTFTTTATTSVTLPTSGTLVNSAVVTLSSLASIGTITTGVWQGTAVDVTHGGTGANLSATGGTSQVVQQTTVGGAFTVGQLAASNLSNGTSGSGAVVLVTSATLVTPTLGAASATSINKVAITAPASSATLTIANGKTLTANNSLTFAGTDATTITFQGTDTYVGRTTTDTFTNKTFDTAGTGNSFKINGTAITAVTGTGAAVLAVSPALTGTPTAPTAATNTSTTQIATTAFVCPASSIGPANGYATFANGLILQWGLATVSAGTLLTVTLPITFPSGVISVFSSVTSSAVNAVQFSTAEAVSASQIALGLNTGTQSVYWLVIGN